MYLDQAIQELRRRRETTFDLLTAINQAFDRLYEIVPPPQPEPYTYGKYPKPQVIPQPEVHQAIARELGIEPTNQFRATLRKLFRQREVSSCETYGSYGYRLAKKG